MNTPEGKKGGITATYTVEAVKHFYNTLEEADIEKWREKIGEKSIINEAKHQGVALLVGLVNRIRHEQMEQEISS